MRENTGELSSFFVISQSLSKLSNFESTQPSEKDITRASCLFTASPPSTIYSSLTSTHPSNQSSSSSSESSESAFFFFIQLVASLAGPAAMAGAGAGALLTGAAFAAPKPHCVRT